METMSAYRFIRLSGIITRMSTILISLIAYLIDGYKANEDGIRATLHSS